MEQRVSLITLGVKDVAETFHSPDGGLRLPD
jgi:hypothetical protein